jgi:hypothetical protein
MKGLSYAEDYFEARGGSGPSGEVQQQYYFVFVRGEDFCCGGGGDWRAWGDFEEGGCYAGGGGD